MVTINQRFLLHIYRPQFSLHLLLHLLFQQDQTRVHQQMNGTSSSSNEARPDAEESQQFWRDIWGKEVSNNENEE